LEVNYIYQQYLLRTWISYLSINTR